MSKLLFTLLLIIVGLVCGYTLQFIAVHKGEKYVTAIPRFRKRLQCTSMLGIMPVSTIGAIWIIPFGDLRVTLMPVLGASLLLLGGILGLAAATILKQEGIQKGVFYCCGSFANIGSIGGLASFLFFGEAGFAYLALYRMFEEMVYYAIGFPIARYYSGAGRGLHLGDRLAELLKDPFFLVATSSFFLGLLLNFSGVPRPDGYERLNSILVPLGIFMILVSVGLSIHFTGIRRYLVPSLAISLIKFIIIPLIGGTVGYFLGFHQIHDGLPLKIVLLASSMPVAFNTLVAASIYDLDLDLANTCWLITTAALVVVLPWLSFLFSLF